MLNTRFRAVAALFAVGVFAVLSNPARADVNWVMQGSQNVVTLSGAFGEVLYNYDNKSVAEVNGGPAWLEKFTAVPQTDPGTGAFAGFSNSMQTSASGTISTVGSSFLSSLNFGSRPTEYYNAQLPDKGYNAFVANNEKLTFANNGNWLPEQPNATGGFTNYGTASPAQAAFTLVGATGQNWNNTGPINNTPGGGPLDPGQGPNNLGTAGRVSLINTGGTLDSNGTPITVTQGAFSTSNVEITGIVGLMAFYNGNLGDSDQPGPLPFPGSLIFSLNNGQLSAGNDDTNQVGSISRNGAAYVLHVQYTAFINVPLPAGGPGTVDAPQFGPNIGTAQFINAQFGGNFTATATLAQGDVNFDGIVNIGDLTQVGSNWLKSDQNTSNPGMIPGDANGDGIVNIADLTLIGSNWLATTPSGSSLTGASVPEPGTWILLGIGTIGLLFARRRL